MRQYLCQKRQSRLRISVLPRAPSRTRPGTQRCAVEALRPSQSVRQTTETESQRSVSVSVCTVSQYLLIFPHSIKDLRMCIPLACQLWRILQNSNRRKKTLPNSTWPLSSVLIEIDLSFCVHSQCGKCLSATIKGRSVLGQNADRPIEVCQCLMNAKRE